MYPCLQTLLITNSKDLTSLLIRCQNLSKVELVKLPVIQVIDIEAPELLVLSVNLAFHDLRIPTPTARILSTKLTDLAWEAPYDPTRVTIRDLAPVLRLSAPHLSVCLNEGAQCPRLDMMCAQFLHTFWKLQQLHLTIFFSSMVKDADLLSQSDIPAPVVHTLCLSFRTYGHVFGGRTLKLLKNFTSLTILRMNFQIINKRVNLCSPSCTCDEPENWENEEYHVQFKQLEQIETLNYNGLGHEFEFLKQVVSNAPSLKLARITTWIPGPIPFIEVLKMEAPAGCKFQPE